VIGIPGLLEYGRQCREWFLVPSFILLFAGLRIYAAIAGIFPGRDYDDRVV
jgi:hypothetical protein